MEGTAPSGLEETQGGSAHTCWHLSDSRRAPSTCQPWPLALDTESRVYSSVIPFLSSLQPWGNHSSCKFSRRGLH